MTTIFAVSSGRPPAAIAVIRISGPAALAAAEALAGSLPPPRHAGVRALRDPAGALLDRALVLVFPGPASATGEDLVELHCHGGRAVVAAVESALAQKPGLRAAAPGEFTRRALLNGRIDLAEAQGLADLLEAETESQRLAALGGAEGRISAAVNDWLRELAMLSARVEALLDFADEDDVGGDADLTHVVAGMAALAASLGEVLSAPSVERLRDGIRVVLAGPPNAGKSTLLNLLAEREVAIVSEIPGTTRDRIEISLQRRGVAYLLTDTAGLRDETGDPIEREGMARAQGAVARADLLLWLGDEAPPRHDAIWLNPRSDLPAREAAGPGRLAVARSRPESIAALWDCIDARARALLPNVGDFAMNRSQRAVCADAAEWLEVRSDDPLIIAEHLRRAHRSLATIIGQDAPEAMLDALFSRFCLGK